ncbi:hypothetical protein CCP3SC1AL1_2900003 [Gammaproteobacteria bacterium]
MTFSFVKRKDTQGQEYFNCYSNIMTDTTICLDKKNFVLRGVPKLFVRRGNKNFRSQLVFQFLIRQKQVRDYNANTDWEVLEFYLPEKEGLDFLKQSIDRFETGNFEVETRVSLDGKEMEEEKFNHQDWEKITCDACGEQMFCPKCQKYAWKQKESK